jgi:hypothetical protein
MQVITELLQWMDQGCTQHIAHSRDPHHLRRHASGPTTQDSRQQGQAKGVEYVHFCDKDEHKEEVKEEEKEEADNKEKEADYNNNSDNVDDNADNNTEVDTMLAELLRLGLSILPTCHGNFSDCVHHLFNIHVIIHPFLPLQTNHSSSS